MDQGCLEFEVEEEIENTYEQQGKLKHETMIFIL